MFLFTLFKTTSAAHQSTLKMSEREIGMAVSRAMEDLKKGDAPGALRNISALLNQENLPDKIKLVAGRSLYLMKRYPEAAEYLDKYIENHPNSFAGLLIGGLNAAKIRELAKASKYIGQAMRLIPLKAREYFNASLNGAGIDPVKLEEMVEEVESYPGDRDRALALLCALAKAGHYTAAERFIYALD
ncbi:MAG TPA: hypothetical protein VGB30_00770 [bacterium]|jgi:tetratricopeptide (TPR) repeat protein